MTRIFFIIIFIFCHFTSLTQHYDAVVSSHQTNITIRNNKLTRDVFYEIQILTRAGEKYSTITIPYSKLNRLSKLEAYIKDSNGRIVKKLRNSEITERSAISDFSLYEDDYIKEFTLKHNSYPYSIVYSYRIQQKEFLHIDYWIPIISEKIPTTKAELKLTVPLGFEIAYKNQHVNNPIVDSSDKVVNFYWQIRYTDLIKQEVSAPPIHDFLPSVVIVPKEFTFEKEGSFTDWKSYGNWHHDLLQGLNALPENEKRKIHVLTRDVEDDKEKIRILYHYLQDETRYINISIETGGMKPYPAQYVALNKYGDCKALTNYFKAAMDFVGISAYYTLVFAGSPDRVIDKNFPSQQFNHVILYIPQDDQDIWLDCTSDGPFNFLGTFTQNRDALMIDHNNSSLIRTPRLEPLNVLDTRKIEINYSPHGALANFHNYYRGESYQMLLQLEKNTNESEKALIVRNYVVEDGFQLMDYALSPAHRDSVRIELSYEATSQNIYKHYGNDILLSNIAFSIPDFEKPDDRKLPVQIEFPIYQIDTLIYEIPLGYKLHSSQDRYSVVSEFGEYEFNIHKLEDKIMVAKSLLIHAGHLPISEYESFYAFYKQIADIEKKIHVSLFK